jgi:NitT/TauT family transport system substrate-binding protein
VIKININRHHSLSVLSAIAIGLLLAIAGNVSSVSAQPGTASPPNKPATTNVVLRLDWTANGKYAPFALGIEKGFFLEQGIALKLLAGRGSLSAVQLVANKSNDFAFADTTSAIIVAGGGGPVTVVGVLQQRTPVCAISFKPLNKPTDLYGMNVGITPVGEDSVWTAFAARNNLDLAKIHMIMMDGPSLLPALVAGRLDATVGVANGEGAAAAILAGKKDNLLYFADYGANVLAHGIIVHRDLIKTQPNLIKRFMAATVKSWDYAIKHKSEAVDALLKEFPDARKDIMARQFDISIPLIHTANSVGRPTGFVVEKDIKETFDILTKYGGLQNPPSPTDVFTNQFLPTAN